MLRNQLPKNQSRSYQNKIEILTTKNKNKNQTHLRIKVYQNYKSCTSMPSISSGEMIDAIRRDAILSNLTWKKIKKRTLGFIMKQLQCFIV